VIGASDQSGSFGGETVRRLLKFAFPGRVTPVSRTSTTVAGLPCYASVAQMPEPPELAVFAIPAQALVDAIRECAQSGVRHGIAYAGGLAEAGGEGADLQRALVALCRETGFVLCGPNCVGIIDAVTPVTATFATALHEMDALRPGPISLVCQSGGIATTSLSIIQEAGFGVRYVVSSGNEAVVDFADYVHAFAHDPQTRIIGGYLEGIGNGPKFVRALEAARRNGKPVVLVKAGITSATARAAQAHTGALVGEDRVVDAVLRELGVMRAHSIEELVDLLLLLAGNEGKVCAGTGVGVITFGGGNGVLAADQCAQAGLSTPALREQCVERLRPLLISVATAANPLDLTPSTAFRADAMERLPQAIDVVASEPSIQSLVFIAGSMAAKANEISQVMCGLAQRARVPVCVSWPSPPRGVPARLAAEGLHAFTEPARGIRALAKLVTREPPRAPLPATFAPFDWQSFVATDDAPAVVTEPTCHRILAATGLSVAAGALVDDEETAVAAASAIGLPVVLKGVSARIAHRAKAGLVAIDLRAESDVRAAFRRIVASAELDGVYVQKMQAGGAELLVSAFRDPVFGVMVSVGSGGVLTEILDDVVTERAPVSVELASRMIDRLRIRRDAQASITEAPAQFIARFAELAQSAPWTKFVLEVNPLLWQHDAAVAVDGLLIVG
jgi:acetyltransferase